MQPAVARLLPVLRAVSLCGSRSRPQVAHPACERTDGRPRHAFPESTVRR